MKSHKIRVCGRNHLVFGLAVFLLGVLSISVLPDDAAGQQLGPGVDFTKGVEVFPHVLRPYASQEVPAPDFKNAPELLQLIQDGKLRLSLAQVVELVMQNNLDILFARYNRYFSQTDVLRAKAGSAPRGSQGVSIPSGLFSGALGAGLGSNATTFTPANGPAISAAARAVTLSPRGTYDPIFTINFSLDQSASPLNNLRVAGVLNSTAHTETLQTRYAQAFTTGTTFSLSFNSQRQSTNQRVLFSPAYVPSLGLDVTQQLLNGFGFAPNRRFLEVAQNGRQVAREVYRQQVMTTLAQVLSSYWDLVAFRETVRAAEQALQVSQHLYEDNKKQAEVGTLAALDVTSAESEVAGRQRDLIVARTNVQQAEVQFKTLISKQLDPTLASAAMETAEALPAAQDTDIPNLDEALATAQQNRPEIPQAEGNLMSAKVAEAFSRDSLKPSLMLFGQYSTASLYGSSFIPGPNGTIIEIPGGWGTSLTQLLHSDFPQYSFGFSLTINLRNRSAQADNIRSRVEERQGETGLQRTRNQIELEVRNAVTALVQAKAQTQAAQQAVAYSAQTVDAEQKKLAAGVSTPYNVILVQRDLLSAQLQEVQARATYAKARVEMDRATGVILEKNHVNPEDVPRADLRQFSSGK
jgi:outer membrane protein